MRKVTRGDWIALAVPAAVIVLVGIVTIQDRGWVPGLVTAALMLASAVWLWRRQIRRHPEDTWRARL